MSFLCYILSTHIILTGFYYHRSPAHASDDGNLIEAHKAVALWLTLINEDGIDVLHICQADEFVDGSIVTDIPFQLRMGFTSLLGRLSEHGHIENVRFPGLIHIANSKAMSLWA